MVYYRNKQARTLDYDCYSIFHCGEAVGSGKNPIETRLNKINVRQNRGFAAHNADVNRLCRKDDSRWLVEKPKTLLDS